MTEASEPETALVTGIGSYVHYGCHHFGPSAFVCFLAARDPRWTVYKH